MIYEVRKNAKGRTEARAVGEVTRTQISRPGGESVSRTEFVEFVVNLDWLFDQLAFQAMRSKRGRATMGAGAVIAKVVKPAAVRQAAAQVKAVRKG